MKSGKIYIKLICVALLTILVFTSCASDTTSEPSEALQQSMTLQDLLDMAYERRLGIYPPDTERLTQLTYGRPPNTIDVAMSFYQQPRTTRRLSADDVIRDIQLFFDILREVYGAYTYFGGDEVFLPIFDTILEELATRDYWYPDTFLPVVYNGLAPYITDNHLRIGHHFHREYSFVSSYSVFASPSLFDRTDNGFRDKSNGLYVREIVGHDIDDVLRLTINQYGEFLYTPVIVDHNNHEECNCLVIVYENGEIATLQFNAASNESRPAHREPSLEIIDGFPVVTINQMYFEHFTPESIERANTFMSFVDKLQDEPALIIDLRGNGGGNGHLAPRWLYNLVGEFVLSNSVGLVAESYDFYSAWRVPNPENPFYQPACEVTMQRVSLPFGDNHVLRVHREPDIVRQMVSNDQLIIFLTSRHTASAAEDFIDMAFNMENTLVIGQNTTGALLTNLCFPWRVLPYTGTTFSLGSIVTIHADAHNFREGVGFAPDIWVPHNEDALLAALALLRNHFGESE